MRAEIKFDKSGKYVCQLSMCGSYTVEASLVLPLVVLVLAVLVYMIFYLHDRYVLQIYADRMAQECCWLYAESENHWPQADSRDIMAAVQNKYETELQGQLLMLSLENSLGTCKKNILTQKYTVQWRVVGKPLLQINTEPFISFGKVICERSSERIHARYWIYAHDLIKEAY